MHFTYWAYPIKKLFVNYNTKPSNLWQTKKHQENLGCNNSTVSLFAMFARCSMASGMTKSLPGGEDTFKNCCIEISCCKSWFLSVWALKNQESATRSINSSKSSLNMSIVRQAKRSSLKVIRGSQGHFCMWSLYKVPITAELTLLMEWRYHVVQEK